MAPRPRGLAFALVVGAIMLGLAAGHFVVEKNSITVLQPEEYKSKHDSAIGNFGVPKYGGSMLGVVMYPGTDSSGCEKFSETFKSKSKRPVFLLLDRGGCYFTKKAWHGQNAHAAAVLVADNKEEHLVTMDVPNKDPEGYTEKIRIPSALIKKSFGDTLKKALKGKEEVVVKMDWSESVPHPDNRVEYEFWTNSNDECGQRCDEQMNFIRNFKAYAQLLERGGYTLFTPHYITWFCPTIFRHTKQCKSQCINNGRYCAPDPESDFGSGYEGKDVVRENLRQLCVHRVANESKRPWVWWDFVTDFHIRCSMKHKRYSKECAETVVKSLGLSPEKIDKCMGDPNVDGENSVLKEEQAAQVGKGKRGDVTILPTLVINNVQYRGVLERTAVLKAICAGFKESTEPSVCLGGDIQTNECLERNGGCWQDLKHNVTACKDTFRGRVCECPTAHGIRYSGDGYTSCHPVGPGRCSINNGGCWKHTRYGETFSACTDDKEGCHCPDGFEGDGKNCEEIDECKEGTICRCDGCICKNSWGSYDCTCKGNLIYLASEDTCIARGSSKFAWFLTFLLLGSVAAAATAGYVFYKYRLRSYMDSEIMAIMSQYMPLDNQHNEAQPLRETNDAHHPRESPTV